MNIIGIKTHISSDNESHFVLGAVLDLAPPIFFFWFFFLCKRLLERLCIQTTGVRGGGGLMGL